jgi:hypothetical protein
MHLQCRSYEQTCKGIGISFRVKKEPPVVKAGKVAKCVYSRHQRRCIEHDGKDQLLQSPTEEQARVAPSVSSG